MEEKILKKILQQAPFGYAYHRILLNEQDEAIDHIFLDINPAFEEMTGLRRENILGKRATEVLPGIRTGSFDWVDIYDRVVITGERSEFCQYLEPLGRWYEITAFALQKGYFVAIFQEVTEEMEQIKALEAQKRQIKELTRELETVFNSTQDAMFLVRVENGEFRYMRNNATHQKLTGFCLEEIK